MKGIQGLAIAGAMGVVGAVCNYLYIAQRARELEKVDFVYIKADARVNAGQKFKDKHFGRVSIPKKYIGNLEKIAVKWDARHTVGGLVAHKSYNANEILLNTDLRTPAQTTISGLLSPDEISREVLVDSATFISSHLNPTDRVLFFAPTGTRGGGAADPSGTLRQAGPFRILAIGSRLGSIDVAKAAGMRRSQGSTITVPLMFKDNKYDKQALELQELIANSNGQGLTVSIVSAQKKTEAKR